MNCIWGRVFKLHIHAKVVFISMKFRVSGGMAVILSETKGCWGEKVPCLGETGTQSCESERFLCERVINIITRTVKTGCKKFLVKTNGFLL